MKSKKDMIGDIKSILNSNNKLSKNTPSVHCIQIPSLQDNKELHSAGIEEINNISSEISGCYWIDTDMPYNDILENTKTLEGPNNSKIEKRCEDIKNNAQKYGITYIGKDQCLKDRICAHLLNDLQMISGYKAMRFNINDSPFNQYNWLIAYIEINDESIRSEIKNLYLSKFRKPVLIFREG